MRGSVYVLTVPILLLGCNAPEPLAGPAAVPVALAGRGIPGGPKCVAVELTPAEATISVGGTLQMSALAYNKKGSLLPNAPIQWQSSAPNVGTVSASGLVAGVSAGQTNILASCAGNVGSALIVVGP